jgi:hypothetical protein
MKLNNVIAKYQQARALLTEITPRWSHRRIADQMAALRKQGLPVETVTVQKNGKRWTLYVIQGGDIESA